MARYHVTWTDKSKTLTIVPYGTKDKKSADVVGDIYLAVKGEVPDAAPAPEPNEHLRNLARQQGMPDFRRVAVVNKTDHDGFDAFEQEVDKQVQEAWDAGEARKLVAGESPRSNTEDPEVVSASDRVSLDSTDGQQNGPSI